MPGTPRIYTEVCLGHGGEWGAGVGQGLLWGFQCILFEPM